MVQHDSHKLCGNVAVKIAAIALIVAVMLSVASVKANPPPAMVECPDHSHVWNANQCPTPNAGSPFGFPGSGHGGGNGGGGLLGALGHIL
jgi:hypothetical protein